MKDTLAARVRDRLIVRWQVGEGSVAAFSSHSSQRDYSLERILAAE